MKKIFITFVVAGLLTAGIAHASSTITTGEQSAAPGTNYMGEAAPVPSERSRADGLPSAGVPEMPTSEAVPSNYQGSMEPLPPNPDGTLANPQLFEGQKTNCKVNGKYVSCAELKEDVKGFVGMGLKIMLGLALIGLACFVFWIIMLIHAIQNPIENKAIWIICFIVFGVVTAIVYYFAVKRTFVAPASTPLPQSPVPPLI